MTPATKIVLFSVLTNLCDLTRLTTLLLLLIALLANMAVSFIVFDSILFQSFQIPRGYRSRCDAISGFGRRFVVPGTFGLDLARQASTLCSRHCWHGNEGMELLDLTPCAFCCSQFLIAVRSFPRSFSCQYKTIDKKKKTIERSYQIFDYY